MKLCVRITQTDEGEYRAICPALPGCVSRGHTREEAEFRLDEAIRGYIAAMCNFVPDRVSHDVVETRAI